MYGLDMFGSFSVEKSRVFHATDRYPESVIIVALSTRMHEAPTKGSSNKSSKLSRHALLRSSERPGVLLSCGNSGPANLART